MCMGRVYRYVQGCAYGWVNVYGCRHACGPKRLRLKICNFFASNAGNTVRRQILWHWHMRFYVLLHLYVRFYRVLQHLHLRFVALIGEVFLCFVEFTCEFARICCIYRCVFVHLLHLHVHFSRFCWIYGCIQLCFHVQFLLVPKIRQTNTKTSFRFDGAIVMV